MMIFEFKTTNKNTYGHRKYLRIDTNLKVFSTHCPSIVTPGIEIKTKDYKKLIEQIRKDGFIEEV